MFFKIVLHLLLLTGACLGSLCKHPICGEQETKSFLDFYGIAYNDTVEFENIRSQTLEAVLWLEAASDCQIIITGAIEQGVSQGSKDYYNGYKINVASNDCLDEYIPATFVKLPADDVVKYTRYRCHRDFIYTELQGEWSIVA